MKTMASGLGQVDNIGDTVLRRVFLDNLRGVAPLTVFVGNRQKDYLDALRLRPEDVLVTDKKKWRKSLASGLWSGDIVYGFNSGELEVDRLYAKFYARVAPLLWINKLRGGHAIHAGFGLRPPAGAWRHPIKLALRSCDIVAWRDGWSRDMMGIGFFSPDWAFSEGTPTAELLSEKTRRPYLSIALRYNRSLPSAEWLQALGGFAEKEQLQIRIVSQIERDQRIAEGLQKHTGGEIVSWADSNLWNQEQKIRTVYRDSEYIVSNRLHGLIIGYTEGALPIAVASSTEDKVARAFSSIGVSGNIVNPVPRTLDDFDTPFLDMRRRRVEAYISLGQARKALNETARLMRVVTKAGSRSP